MAKYALINLSPISDAGKRQEFEGSPDDETRKGVKWVPVTRADDPIFDASTHKLVRADDAVTIDALTESREAVLMTQEELDLRAAQLERTATDDQLRSWIPTFAAKTATNNQIQRVLEELLIRSVGE